jgi:pimeloyl-ACP methyl ester carboxylesterase
VRILAVVVAIAVSGCGLFAVKGQQQKLDAACQISGQVEAELGADAPIVVALLRLDAGRWQIADHFVLEGPGRWGFSATPGSYGLAAFQDVNRDLKLEPDEPFVGANRDEPLTCVPGERRSDLALRVPAAGRTGRDEIFDVAALQVRSHTEQLELSLSQVTAIGEVASLSDPRFDLAVAQDGLWRPYDFLFKGQPGIYFLGEYDRAKIPVLFVHGINGSPQNFRTLIGQLDDAHFQPWVYYYPSGAALASVADHLTQTMRKLQLQHGFTRFVVVAHSMGGLVSRGFLVRYRADGRAAVPLFVSIATPWDGHKAAEIGVKTAPAAVRVWMDMAPGSAYLKSIYENDLDVPHHLLFTFRNDGTLSLGETSDGTVTVASQLRPAAQHAAVRVEGYNETHVSVLESPALSQRLNELLAPIR